MNSYPQVSHTHMPTGTTARMRSLRHDKQLLLDQVKAIDDVMVMLIEHEQRKVFAAFKDFIATTAVDQFALQTSPSLDLEPLATNEEKIQGHAS